MSRYLEVSLKKLADRRPELRIHLVPMLRQAGADDPLKMMKDGNAKAEGYLKDLKDLLSEVEAADKADSDGAKKTAMQFTEKEWESYSKKHPGAKRRNHIIEESRDSKEYKEQKKRDKGQKKDNAAREKVFIKADELRKKYKNTRKLFRANEKEVAKLQKAFFDSSPEWKKKNAPAIRKVLKKADSTLSELNDTAKKFRDLKERVGMRHSLSHNENPKLSKVITTSILLLTAAAVILPFAAISAPVVVASGAAAAVMPAGNVAFLMAFMGGGSILTGGTILQGNLEKKIPWSKESDKYLKTGDYLRSFIQQEDQERYEKDQKKQQRELKRRLKEQELEREAWKASIAMTRTAYQMEELQKGPQPEDSWTDEQRAMKAKVTEYRAEIRLIKEGKEVMGPYWGKSKKQLSSMKGHKTKLENKLKKSLAA